MWLRIKHLSIPISIKLTILYVVILTCILLFTSVLTVAGLSYMLYAQADDDIGLSTNSVIRYLAAGNPLDQHMLEANLLVPGVMLKIFDEQNHLLIDSAPYVSGNRMLLAEYDEDINPVKLPPLKKRPLR